LAENQFIEEKKKKKKSSGPSLFSKLENGLAINWLSSQDNFSKLFLRFAFIVSLGIIYIYNTHLSERLSREYDYLVKEVEDLRTHYTTLHADVMLQSKESEVLKKVKPLGLTDGDAPERIIVEEE